MKFLQLLFRDCVIFFKILINKSNIKKSLINGESKKYYKFLFYLIFIYFVQIICRYYVFKDKIKLNKVFSHSNNNFLFKNNKILKLKDNNLIVSNMFNFDIMNKFVNNQNFSRNIKYILDHHSKNNSGKQVFFLDEIQFTNLNTFERHCYRPVFINEETLEAYATSTINQYNKFDNIYFNIDGENYIDFHDFYVHMLIISEEILQNENFNELVEIFKKNDIDNVLTLSEIDANRADFFYSFLIPKCLGEYKTKNKFTFIYEFTKSVLFIDKTIYNNLFLQYKTIFFDVNNFEDIFTDFLLSNNKMITFKELFQDEFNNYQLLSQFQKNKKEYKLFNKIFLTIVKIKNNVPYEDFTDFKDIGFIYIPYYMQFVVFNNDINSFEEKIYQGLFSNKYDNDFLKKKLFFQFQLWIPDQIKNYNFNIDLFLRLFFARLTRISFLVAKKSLDLSRVKTNSILNQVPSNQLREINEDFHLNFLFFSDLLFNSSNKFKDYLLLKNKIENNSRILNLLKNYVYMNGYIENNKKRFFKLLQNI